MKEYKYYWSFSEFLEDNIREEFIQNQYCIFYFQPELYGLSFEATATEVCMIYRLPIFKMLSYITIGLN